jgi:hypothetical protein
MCCFHHLGQFVSRAGEIKVLMDIQRHDMSSDIPMRKVRPSILSCRWNRDVNADGVKVSLTLASHNSCQTSL